MGEVAEGLPAAYSLTLSGGEERAHSWEFSGHATAKYTNGDVYEGEFVEGKKQGAGSYTYRNGDVFEGEYEANLRTGVGRIVYADGSSYSGHFVGGVRHGEGTMVYGNMDVYSGGWEYGKKNSKGIYVFAKSKYFYEGRWVDGEITEGRWILTRDKFYEGPFLKQIPTGKGKFVFGDPTKLHAKVCEVSGEYTQEVLPLNSGTDVGGKPPLEVRISWTTAELN